MVPRRVRVRQVAEVSHTYCQHGLKQTEAPSAAISKASLHQNCILDQYLPFYKLGHKTWSKSGRNTHFPINIMLGRKSDFCYRLFIIAKENWHLMSETKKCTTEFLFLTWNLRTNYPKTLTVVFRCKAHLTSPLFRKGIQALKWKARSVLSLTSGSLGFTRHLIVRTGSPKIPKPNF